MHLALNCRWFMEHHPQGWASPPGSIDPRPRILLNRETDKDAALLRNRPISSEYAQPCRKLCNVMFYIDQSQVSGNSESIIFPKRPMIYWQIQMITALRRFTLQYNWKIIVCLKGFVSLNYFRCKIINKKRSWIFLVGIESISE